jgi:hypothetical protein
VGGEESCERRDKNVPVCKVSRLCPLVLSTGARLREGEALGSEGGKVLGSGFC